MLSLKPILALLVATCMTIQATPNFDLINIHPKRPIYVQANGGPWQVLNEKHYRYPIDVAEGSLLIISLSAQEDKSTPTSLIFAPERALEIAKQVNAKIIKAPTFYVQAEIVKTKVPGSDAIIDVVKLSPQSAQGADNKTKSGLSLENNVNQEMIDMIVEIATSKEQEQPQEPAKQVATEIIQIKQEAPIIKTVEPKEEPPTLSADTTSQDKPMRAIGPMVPTTLLQHTDTPHMIAATLKKMSDQEGKKDRRALWTEIRTYLVTPQAAATLGNLDDAAIYNQLKDHYQMLADQTKSSLKQIYKEIIETITKSYKKLPRTNRKSKV